MKRFSDFITEEVVPAALVQNGSIDLDKEEVRASINMALAKVTADGVVTPYIALNRIQKALAYFHIILPKKVYLDGAKGVEVHELRQFGHKMGMTNDGEFVHEVPGKYFLFMQYAMNTPMVHGGQKAWPTMGGTFRVMAKVVDQVELDRLVSMAELALAEDYMDAEAQQMKAKVAAPHETMKDVTSDEKKKGNKAAVGVSQKGLKEGRGMPASVIASKEKYANMSDKEFAEKHGHKSEKELRAMAGRHGYGYDKKTKTGSDHYVSRVAKSKQMEEDKDPCWKGYEMVGMKKKGGRKVPNCVPVKEEQIDEIKVSTAYSYAGKKMEKERKGLLPGDHNPTSKTELKNMRNAAERTDKDYYKKRGFKKIEEEQIDEKAPPGAKFERMVKHIKKGYSKGGLTAKEKGIAYATSWKAKKRESKD